MQNRKGNPLLTFLGILTLVYFTGFGQVTTASAQTQYIPYYGKNRVKYDNFKWHIYATDHFEIFYYPELEQHIERVAGYAESAYQLVSSDLRHDLAFQIPLVLFKTHSEFEQQNVLPADIPEGIAAFAEPLRNRMVLPIDEPPDELYRLIVHELTHIFEFDIIPQSILGQSMPLWVAEGLADYIPGVWDPLDLMMVRDAAVADIIPRMTVPDEFFGFTNPRLPYNLGHAAFEFMESRWGKQGIREFLFALRSNIVGGGSDAYMEATDLTAEDWDREFSEYIRDRFHAFRDKERPEAYGRNLAPDPRVSSFVAAYSIEPSPSGDLLAAVATNRKDQELDIILISIQDGEVIRNVTPGFSQDHGYEYISIPGARWTTVPWMSWSPSGDNLAYFVRKGKHKTLIVRNVLTRRIEQRFDMQMVDEPESPAFSPNSQQIAFSALENAIGDIYLLDLNSGNVTNVTNDNFAAYAPTFSPDGSSLVYLARVSGNNKLFQLDLSTGEKTQLTFGAHDETAARFLNEDTLVFSSTATDPTQPIDPDIARNGNIYNIWTLSLSTGLLKQHTDTVTGNVSTVPISAQDSDSKVGFVAYFKGNYSVHTMNLETSITEVASSDFGAPGPIFDFQAPLTHTFIADNARRKGAFEKLFMDGRPPINFGVSSSGDILGGSALSFTDLLGEQQFSMFAVSVAQYRTGQFSYSNLSGRFQWGAQAFSQTQFFFTPGYSLYSTFDFLTRDQAIATQTMRGATVFGIYPISRFRRLELSAGFYHSSENFDDPSVQTANEAFLSNEFGVELFRDGLFAPLTATYVQETTIFREFGPLAGNTVRISFTESPKLGNTLSQRSVDADARYYFRLGDTGLLAFRARGFKSWGDYPDFTFFGGNSEMRGYEYLEFIGHKAFFANVELRFPLVTAMATPIGILGGIRGAFFFNIGAAGINNQPFTPYTSEPEQVSPVMQVLTDPNTGLLTPIRANPMTLSGFRLKDARASYGFGLQTMALGFPIHFDWSWRTLFNETWENMLFGGFTGGEAFRRAKFDMWIGYDF